MSECELVSDCEETEGGTNKIKMRAESRIIGLRFGGKWLWIG